MTNDNTSHPLGSDADATVASEVEPLLGPQPRLDTCCNGGDNDIEKYISRALPLAFTAALAIAVTSATTMFAYVNILCADPAQCYPGEPGHYASTFAAAAKIANIFGIIAVGIVRIWAESNPKVGLYLWFACRGLGLGVLLIGVFLENMYIAISGRILDGFAADYILHFTLATIYVKTKDRRRFSRLMGTSLALYMIGSAFSPAVVTLLPNFVFSFVTTIAILGLSLLYIIMAIPSDGSKRKQGIRDDTSSTPNMNETTILTTRANSSTSIGTISTLVFNPICYMYSEPAIRLPGLSLLLYTCTQAYLFSAIVVYVYLELRFTEPEYGYLATTGAVTSSVYLIFLLYGVPRLQRIWKREQSVDGNGINSEAGGNNRPPTRDFICSVVSMSAQLLAIPWFIAAQNRGMVYGLASAVSLGIAAPSFLKSYAVFSTSLDDDATAKASALGSLALMESVGSLLSPIILGSLPSYFKDVFIVASSLVGAATLCLIVNFVITKRR